MHEAEKWDNENDRTTFTASTMLMTAWILGVVIAIALGLLITRVLRAQSGRSRRSRNLWRQAT